MWIVTQQDIEKGLREVGLGRGEMVFFHSSMSSFGYIVNGADAVIDAFLRLVGAQGTVVVPTFVLEDRLGEFGAWWNSATTRSSVGQITEVFRRRPTSRRSDHPIHSVAAIGARAEALTRVQLAGGERLSPWEGSFSIGGPFDHLYEQNARYVMLGAGFMTQTMCHYVETLMVEQALQRAALADIALYQNLRSQVRQVFRGSGIWPGFDRVRMGLRLLDLGVWRHTRIGRADVYLAETRPYVAAVQSILEADPAAWFQDSYLTWLGQTPGAPSIRPSPAALPPSRKEVPVAPPDPPQDQISVPAGWFIQGSLASDKDARPDERPQRLVYLDSFTLDRHPVTNAEYRHFVQASGHRAPPHWLQGEIPAGQELLPVTYVDWYDATAYAAWAGKRLPGEAEWEKAARGGLLLDGVSQENPLPWRRYPWGDAFDASRCATTEAQVYGAAPVESYMPAGDSPYGIADMAGNVWEWVADWYDATSYSTGADRNPAGPAQGLQKVLRGGAGGSRGVYARCACRCALDPMRVFSTNGFRCARSI